MYKIMTPLGCNGSENVMESDSLLRASTIGGGKSAGTAGGQDKPNFSSLYTNKHRIIIMHVYQCIHVVCCMILTLTTSTCVLTYFLHR